jgi:hypothetical protein
LNVCTFALERERLTIFWGDAGAGFKLESGTENSKVLSQGENLAKEVKSVSQTVLA